MMTLEYVARTFRTAIEYRIAIIAYKVSDLAHLLCKWRICKSSFIATFAIV